MENENFNIQPWIEIREVTGSHLKGLDDFYKELAEVGSVHIRKKWLPSFCTGAELWIGIRIGIGFLLSTWVTGKLYDQMKIWESKLLHAFNKLINENAGDVDFNSFYIEYDDLTLNFSLLPPSKISEVGLFMNRLPKHIEFFTRHGVNNIDSISILVEGEKISDLQEQNEELKSLDMNDYFRIWKIKYEFGCCIAYYDSTRQQFLKDNF